MSKKRKFHFKFVNALVFFILLTTKCTFVRSLTSNKNRILLFEKKLSDIAAEEKSKWLPMLNVGSSSLKIQNGELSILDKFSNKVISKGTKRLIENSETNTSITLSLNSIENTTAALNNTENFDTFNQPQNKHLIQKRDLPFIYQSPPKVSCPQAGSTSIISGARAVDFAAFSLGILTLVININNNINNNNNNNNNINLNAVDSSNIVANFNTNNANQVNIMPPGGRRKRSLVGSTAITIVNILKTILDHVNQEENTLNKKQ